MTTQNMRALVCGASQGIGEAVARTLASEGYGVLLLARSADKLQAIKASLPGSGHEILAQDLGDIEGLERKIKKALEAGPIQILVNNSGGPKAGPLLNADSKEFLQAFTEHVLVSQKLAQALVPGMKQNQFGRIINIISTSVKAPLPNLGVSNTIRAAMGNWSKTLSRELGPFGITVNNVLPGFTLTPRFESLRKSASERLKISEDQVEINWKSEIPASRFAEVSEVADAISFLASRKASYINGINLPVDGGRTASL